MIDMDEWLCINEEELKDEEKNGTTILDITGIDMIGESMKDDLSDINVKDIKRYVYASHESKKLCFLREKINYMNYNCGAHLCNPKGEITYSKKTYYNKHMNYLGVPFYTNKIIERYKRSQHMRNCGMAGHYINNIEQIINKYNSALEESKIFI
jgi:hypothetical protein